jgi:hypothetical protein
MPSCSPSPIVMITARNSVGGSRSSNSGTAIDHCSHSEIAELSAKLTRPTSTTIREGHLANAASTRAANSGRLLMSSSPAIETIVSPVECSRTEKPTGARSGGRESSGGVPWGISVIDVF